MRAAPRLVVGLGNPGAEYTKTRHNAGFWFCERLGSRLGCSYRNESRFHALVAHYRPAGLWLLMPQTFMNCSGQSIGDFVRFHRIPSAEILIVHDELDIPPGQLRLKFGGGLGGHNGLKDSSSHLGTLDYWRLRIGIGHPGERDLVVNYVLKPPCREEREEIETAIDRALDLWPLIQSGDWNAAIQRANARHNVPGTAN